MNYANQKNERRNTDWASSKSKGPNPTMCIPSNKNHGVKKDPPAAPAVKKKMKQDPPSKKKTQYQVSLSPAFVFLLMIGSTLTALNLGKLARGSLERRLEENLEVPSWLEWAVKNSPPTTTWINCTEQPQDSLCSIQESIKVISSSDSESDSDSESESDSDSDDEEDEGEIHENAPSSGQHLLADVSAMDSESVVPNFLQLASSKGWTLKSHYCTTATSTCVLVFQGGHHMVFHKPSQELDIYSTDNEPLLRWLDSFPLIEKWAYKDRGSHFDISVFDAGVTDMNNGFLGTYFYPSKRLVARHQSPFQEVSIYDMIDPQILDGVSVDRQIYLDGVVQSRRLGERAYHEALVHPSMLMHPNPERVAIVGAGEGATLREVLKHNTVKQVIMIEIDSDVMRLSREHLPEWNDCSDLILPEGMVNPTGNCFDDPRAVVYAKDAIRWFLDHYPEDGNNKEELFDVIIMDALDPGDKVEFSDMLFDNPKLLATLHRSLSDDGVFLCQMGEQYSIDDPDPMQTRDRHSVVFVENLGKAGFQRLLDYQEPSTRFDGLWSFVLASKAMGAERWFVNPAQIDVQLHERAMRTKSGAWPFRYYDGATHNSYLVTSRAYIPVMCRGGFNTRDCQRGPGLVRGTNIPFEEAISVQDGVAVARQDLEAGLYVGMEQCVNQTWDIPHEAKQLIDSMADSSIETPVNILKKATTMFGSPAPLLGLEAETLDMGRDTLAKGCPIPDSLSERGEPGVANPSLDRFWRVYECINRRQLHEPISAGSRIGCENPDAQ